MNIISKLFGARNYVEVLIHLLIILLLGFGLVYGFFYWYLPVATQHGQTIKVPEITGMRLYDLPEYMEKNNLRYEVTDSSFNSNIPPLSVIAQYPKAGLSVKTNRKIYITINSKNPPMVPMPKLTDRSLINAQDELESYGLKLGQTEYVPDLQENAVIGQMVNGEKIEPGAPIAKGTKVDLIVGDGLGNQEFDVPNLFGKPLDEAEVQLNGSQLQLGAVVYEENTGHPNGLIFKQKPEDGNKIRIGNVIDVWVTGKPPEPDTLQQN